MLRKPWPIIILSVFFLCAPFINLLYTYYFMRHETSLLNYFYSLAYIESNYIKVFNMMVPGLISAFAIYSVKKWSYPVFLCCILWLGVNAYLNLSSKHELYLLMMLIVIPMLFNIIVVSYFLIPSVKTAYYEPRLRWWEASPRYVVDAETEVQLESKSLSGKVTNISEGGIFIEANDLIENDSTIQLNFKLNDVVFALEAKVIFKLPNSFAYGVQFQNLDSQSIKSVKSLIQKLKESKTEVCRPIPPWSDDLKKWFLNLLKTGEGLTPIVPKEFQKNKK